jgi:uncharacterized protein (DUF1778 family)
MRNDRSFIELRARERARTLLDEAATANCSIRSPA